MRLMSSNYRFYPQRDGKNGRAPKDANSPLRGQLEDLMLVVRRCESMWALEDRIEGSRGNDPKAG